MKCEDLSNDVLMDLAERRAEEKTANEITMHLLECEACGERYLEVTRIRETTRLALQAVPAADLDERVISATQKVLAVKRKRSIRRAVLWIAAGLALAAAAAASLFLFSR